MIYTSQHLRTMPPKTRVGALFIGKGTGNDTAKENQNPRRNCPGDRT